MGCGVGVGYSTGPSYFMGVKGSVVYSWSGPFIFSIQSPFFQFHFIFLCSDINPSTLLFFLQTISLSSLSPFLQQKPALGSPPENFTNFRSEIMNV